MLTSNSFASHKRRISFLLIVYCLGLNFFAKAKQFKLNQGIAITQLKYQLFQKLIKSQKL
jgi:hypothetical protein